MERQDFRILFLDDEIYDREKNPAVLAREELEAAGYAVEVTDKMSDVIEAYYKQYYHLYLLDVDMGRVKDVFAGNGATVGEVLRRLSSISNVVVYSARGTVKDWLTAANYHFYAYIHKDEGEEKLLGVVEDVFVAVHNSPFKIPSLQKHPHSDAVLIYDNQDSDVPKRLRDIYPNLIVFDSLETMPEAIKEYAPQAVVIVIPQFPESMRAQSALMSQLTPIMATQPKPHVLVCLDATRDNRTILQIVNLRPFRLLNRHSPVFENDLREAAESAVLWFGEDEIFELPQETQVIRKPMTEAEIAALRKEDWEYSQWEGTGEDANE